MELKEYKEQVKAMILEKYGLGVGDGDLPSVDDALECGDEPADYAIWWGQKFDLVEFSEAKKAILRQLRLSIDRNRINWGAK